MQIFMPFNSFQASVKCLDKSRLGNQIWREAKTLITGGWPNHPAAKLWANYKPALALYCISGLNELRTRCDISQDTYYQHWAFFSEYLANETATMPPFMGNERFHLSHRLNLLWKLPTHYSRYFDEPVPLTKPDYYWPLDKLHGLTIKR